MKTTVSIRQAQRIAERRHERDLELMRGVANRLCTVLACVDNGTVTPEEALVLVDLYTGQLEGIAP